MSIINMYMFENNIQELLDEYIYVKDNFQDLVCDQIEDTSALKYYRKFKSKKDIQTKDLRKPQPKKKSKVSKPSRKKRKNIKIKRD